MRFMQAMTCQLTRLKPVVDAFKNSANRFAYIGTELNGLIEQKDKIQKGERAFELKHFQYFSILFMTMER